MWSTSAAIGDSVSSLFSQKNQEAQAYQKQLAEDNTQNRYGRTSAYMQNMGVKDMPSYGAGANANSPQYGNEKNRQAATEDPQEVEARWMARLAKFAGISQATGVKLGGL